MGDAEWEKTALKRRGKQGLRRHWRNVNMSGMKAADLKRLPTVIPIAKRKV